MEKMWRTLLRVVSVDRENNVFFIVIPSRGEDEVTALSFDVVPSEYHDSIIVGKRFYMRVNKGVDSVSELRFADYEDAN